MRVTIVLFDNLVIIKDSFYYMSMFMGISKVPIAQTYFAVQYIPPFGIATL